MAYDVQFTGPARRALKSIPPRVVPAIIEFAFGDLAREPHRVGKPLERNSPACAVPAAVPTVCSIASTTKRRGSTSFTSTTEPTSTGRAEPPHRQEQ